MGKSPDEYRNRNASQSSLRQFKQSIMSVISESEGVVATEHIGTQEIEQEDTVIFKKGQPFPANLKCYKTHTLIGKGAFGKVYLASHKITNKEVALKMIEKSVLKPDQLEKVAQEVKLM